MGKIEMALNTCTSLIANLPTKYYKGIWLLYGLLNEPLNKKEATENFKNAIKYDEESRKFLEKKEPIALDIFNTANRLCVEFPSIELSFGSHPPLV